MKKDIGFLGVFGVFWSGMTLLFDGFVFVPAAWQLMATTYPSTEGTILSSEVTHHDSEDGATHGVSVRYAYAVGGEEYTGTRYRYDPFRSSDSKWAFDVVKDRPPGTQVQVFYNPDDPCDSVLSTGLLGSDLFLFAFMTPFNVVMVGFWWVGWDHLRRAWVKPPAGGVKITTSSGTTRVRLTTWSAVEVAVVAVGLLAFCGIFVVGFGWGGFHPPMKTMIVCWAATLGGGLAAGAWHAWKMFSGKYDLIIDEAAGFLELPATKGRKNRCRIALSEVQGVTVENIEKPSDDGPPTRMYAPTLICRGRTQTSEQLLQWANADKAAEFADWLRKRLSLNQGGSYTLDPGQ